MTVREALHYRLNNYSNLTDLVSTRIYSIKMPQGVEYPAVSFHVSSPGPQQHTMNSDAGHPASPLFQVDSWAMTQDDAEDVAIQVSAALKDYSATVSGVVFQRIFQETSTPHIYYEPVIDGYRAMQFYRVWFS